MKRVVIIGCGTLGTVIAEGINSRLNEDYCITAVCDGNEVQARQLAGKLGVTTVASAEEIIRLRPDYLIEAASQKVIASMAPSVLEAGIDMIILSVGALTDEKLVERIDRAGSQSGARLYVASGAIGGFDLMRAVTFGGLEYAEIHTSKNPRSLNGAPYLNGMELPTDRAVQVFSGSSREAIEGFPKNVNVSVSTALSTLGVDHTMVRISSIPDASTNLHEINLKGDFGDIEIKVEVKPSRDNPRSSTMAAWSVLALLQKLSGTIML